MTTLEERFTEWFYKQVTRWGVPEDLTFDELKSIAHEAFMAGYGEAVPDTLPEKEMDDAVRTETEETKPGRGGLWEEGP